MSGKVHKVLHCHNNSNRDANAATRTNYNRYREPFLYIGYSQRPILWNTTSVTQLSIFGCCLTSYLHA